MTYFADLTPCTYFGVSDVPLIAVGWLDSAYPYKRGRVSRKLFEAVATLLVDPWRPFAVAGRHACQFCAFTGGPAEIRFNQYAISLGADNLFVPTEQHVFVAPSLLVHYMDAHEYAPPTEFEHAVEKCPPMRSMEYLKALSKHGVTRLAHPPRS